MGCLNIAQSNEIEGPASRFRRSLAVIGIDLYGEGIRCAPRSPTRRRSRKRCASTASRSWCLFDDDAWPRAFWPSSARSARGARLDRSAAVLLRRSRHRVQRRHRAGRLPGAGVRPPPRSRRVLAHAGRPRRARPAPGALRVRRPRLLLRRTFRSSSRDVEPPAKTLCRERLDAGLSRPRPGRATSASRRELALDVFADDRGEGLGRHSPTTSAPARGLRGAADYTRDGIITADELAMFVRERVATATEAVGCRQVLQLFLSIGTTAVSSCSRSRIGRLTWPRRHRSTTTRIRTAACSRLGAGSAELFFGCARLPHSGWSRP